MMSIAYLCSRKNTLWASDTTLAPGIISAENSVEKGRDEVVVLYAFRFARPEAGLAPATRLCSTLQIASLASPRGPTDIALGPDPDIAAARGECPDGTGELLGVWCIPVVHPSMQNWRSEPDMPVLTLNSSTRLAVHFRCQDLAPLSSPGSHS